MKQSSHLRQKIGLAHILPLAFSLLALVCRQTAGAQENRSASEGQKEPVQEASTESLPRVSIGEITGSPGASLMIPLYFTPDPKNPLRSLAVEIDHVSNSLKFQKASPGTVTEEAGANLEAVLTEGVPDEKGVIRSKLRVTVSLMEKQPQKGLPEGLLAYLLFRVSLEAKPFAIKLNTSVVSAVDVHEPPQKAVKVSAQSGTVVIEQPDLMPEAACFFFTH